MLARRARLSWRSLLVSILALALAAGLLACGGSSDDDPTAVAPETASPPAVRDEPAAPAPPAPPPETPQTPPAPPLPEPPAEAVASPAPEASPPTDEPTPPATAAAEQPDAPVEPPLPDAPAPPAAPRAPQAETTPLLYDTYDLSGAVAAPGHYAFLADPDDPTSAVTTYEGLRDGTATALLVHKADAYGASQAALYDAVAAGDLFEWRQADDCFVRYQVTEVQPDPTGTVPRKLLAVAWMTYAFAGCTGAVATTTAATLDWSALPDLGGTSLTTPVVHGTLQVVPEGWTGAIDPGREAYALPEGAPPYPGPYADTDDQAVARGFPFWREPALPAGWTFRLAFTGGLDVNYGYCAFYEDADGWLAVEICGEALLGPGTWGMVASWLTDGGSYGMRAGASETRWISGRPAVVQYSPEGPNHHRATSVRVRVHDVATQSIYTVVGQHRTLLGSNAEDVIAIARSLFERPPPLLYDTYDRSGAVAAPGHYAFLADPGDPTSVVSTYEGLRDGSTTALLVHQADAYSASQAALYDAVETGDLVEWRQADDCFVRYQVTEVKPDPAGTVPQKLLAVAWMTYAFAGCSGTIATTTAATLDWAELPDLGGTSLATPIRHGPYQIVPEGWTGVTEDPEFHYPTSYSPFTSPTYMSDPDPAVASALPYWREPALPAGWSLHTISRGTVNDPPYGYTVTYSIPGEWVGVRISGSYASDRGWAEEASWSNGGGVYETRMIDGRPARVMYSPPGPNHAPLFPLTVWIYDPATQTEYAVYGYAGILLGNNVDAVVAIARSLFERPGPP